MRDMLAIVSKAIFSKMRNASGGAVRLGDVLGHARYESRHRRLEALEGGSLFLVTARPGDALWLLAILEAPTPDERGWESAPSAIAVTDVTSLVPKLRFDSGKGVQAGAGKLGMSLQTPRVLTEADAALLRKAAGMTENGAKPSKAKRPKEKKAAKTRDGLLAPRVDSMPVELEGGESPLADALAEWAEYDAEDDSIRRAARPFVGASPVSLRNAGWWLEVIDHLEATGWDARDIASVVVRGAMGEYPVDDPGAPNLRRVLAGLDDADLRGLADDLLTKKLAGPLGEVVLLAMLEKGEVPPTYDGLIALESKWDILLELLERLPAKRQKKLLARMWALTDENLARGVSLLLSCRGVLSRAEDERIKTTIFDRADERTGERLLHRWDGAGPPAYEIRGSDEYTPSVRSALEFMELLAKPKKGGATLESVVEARASLAIEVDAPELADVDRWATCTPARREAIAELVESAAQGFGIRFAGFETHAIDVAIFRRGAIELCLVPGGEVVRGFSKREEKRVEELAEPHGGLRANVEEYGSLVDQAAKMRPAKSIRVGPFLIARAPSEPIEPEMVLEQLQAESLRLPSEAEHERAMRGLATSALTWRGDDQPDDAWMAEVSKERLCNDFGLQMFGLYPELCSDAWASSYTGAPTDGRPRLGKGPRVIRGGAIMLAPWQGCGEWHLLTNAMRTSAKDWKYFHSVRPALGIRCE